MKVVCKASIISPTAFKVLTMFDETEPAFDPGIDYQMHRISEMVVDTQEKAIHDGLIALGWMPPANAASPHFHRRKFDHKPGGPGPRLRPHSRKGDPK